MICDLFVALTAARKSALSHALTSPCRLMCGAVGCICMISFGRGPFGPFPLAPGSAVTRRKRITGFGTGGEDGGKVE